jgi:mannitol-1-phosphate/altronate dehydrogenase
MAKKSISIRLPEKFLQHKPSDLGLSDWIRECIHFWILEQEGTRQKIISSVDQTLEKIQEVKLQIKVEEINKLLSELDDFRWKIEKQLGQLRELEKLTRELEQMKETISKSLICKIERYSNSHWDWN